MTEVNIYKGCRVEWVEWRGTRKRPLAIEMVEYGAVVKVKGNMATITLAGGRTFVKRMSTNSFCFSERTTPKRYEAQQAAKARTEAREQKTLEREMRQKMRERKALDKRFAALITGKRFEVIDYFAWRDEGGSNWDRITQKDLRAAFAGSDAHYAQRTLERLEGGEREVVRVGLIHGVRLLGTYKD